MKYIKLDFIPFKIHKKFTVAAKEINDMDNIKLFGKFDAKLTLYRNWFNKTNAIFSFDKFDIFDIHSTFLIQSTTDDSRQSLLAPLVNHVSHHVVNYRESLRRCRHA